MTRRQFNLRAIKEIRELEQTRARERLAEFVDPFFPGMEHAPQGHASDSLVETRRDVKPVSGPLSDRLRKIDPQRFEGEAAKDPAKEKTREVVLEDPEGNQIAALPCNETAGIIILGRGQNATVRISDPYVHRVHAHMRWDSSVNSHIIVHGGGENSTYVNRRKIRAPYTLQNGNRIRLGRTEMIYRIG
ncbi:MAG: FHA domain-containing protein [Thermomicrobiales bacterium]